MGGSLGGTISDLLAQHRSHFYQLFCAEIEFSIIMWMAFPEYFVCRKTKPCKTSWLRKCRNILSRIWGGTEHQNVVFLCVRPPSGYIIIQITEWYSIAICEICVQGNVENISMGVSKFQYFFNSPIVRRRWVCLSEEGWVQPLFCFVLSTFSISHGQGDRRMIQQKDARMFWQQLHSTRA